MGLQRTARGGVVGVRLFDASSSQVKPSPTKAALLRRQEDEDNNNPDDEEGGAGDSSSSSSSASESAVNTGENKDKDNPKSGQGEGDSNEDATDSDTTVMDSTASGDEKQSTSGDPTGDQDKPASTDSSDNPPAPSSSSHEEPTEPSSVDMVTLTSSTSEPPKTESTEKPTQSTESSTTTPLDALSDANSASAAAVSESSDSSSQSYRSTTYIHATPTESSASDTKITDAGPIAGIAIGGVIALALAIWCVYKCCCAGDGSYSRRMGRKPVSAFQKRTFWDDIPAPGDEEKKQQQQPAASAVLPPEPQHAFRNQRGTGNLPSRPVLSSPEPAAAAPEAAPPRRAPIVTSGNAADFTTRRAGVNRPAVSHPYSSGNTNNRTNQATAATSENGQSQWAEVVGEKPLLNPYSAYG